ncbi:hypothetical protein FAUST_7691 [Fusarium austroamericanum]|uniref:Uncharacterized protein n=1 Tax=Fusarium austroamericanum TaxID=282268 RepID=A0AAN6BY05_FUSAU|nr:hypothetical protein FAUST_7691 [Fusarium austroamericanum]
MSKAQFFDYPGTEANGQAFHYSQVVRIGNVLRTSGQGGWDAQGNIIADPQTQVKQAFQNVLTALRTAHPTAEWSNVVSVRTYHTNVEATFDFTTSAFKELDKHLRPVWTCVEIAKLGLEGMVFEIEVEAVI